MKFGLPYAIFNVKIPHNRLIRYMLNPQSTFGLKNTQKVKSNKNRNVEHQRKSMKQALEQETKVHISK